MSPSKNVIRLAFVSLLSWGCTAAPQPSGGPLLEKAQSCSSAGSGVRAVLSMDPARLQEFLDCGGDPNENISGEATERLTPLMVAAARGDAAMIRLLRSHGASVSATFRGFTAEDFAFLLNQRSSIIALRGEAGSRPAPKKRDASSTHALSISFDPRERARSLEVWKSAVAFRIRSSGRFDRWAQLELAMQIAERQPLASSRDILEAIRGYDQKASEILARHGGPEVLLDTTKMQQVVSDLMDLGKLLPGELGLAFTAGDLGRKWAEREVSAYYEGLNSRLSADLAWARARDEAGANLARGAEASQLLDRLGSAMAENPNLALAVGIHTQEFMPGVGPGSSASEILDQLPDFARQRMVADIHGLLKSGKVPTADEIRRIVGAGLGAVSSEVEKLRGEITSSLKDQRTRESKEAQEKSARLRAIRETEEYRAAFELASRLAGLIGEPALGRQVLGAGQAALQVRDALEKFSSGGSSIVLTNDLTSAAMGLYQAFAGIPSPEQQILAEIRRLSNEIRDLRVEMARGFQEINQQLQALLDEVVAGFSDVGRGVVSVSTGVGALQARMLELHASMLALDRKLDENFDRLKIAPLTEKISSCLRQTSFGALPPVASDARACLDAFVAFATFEDVAGNSADPLARLNDFALTTFRAPLASPAALDAAGGRLPNPMIWRRATSALLRYIEQVPQARIGLGTATWESVIAAGSALHSAFQKLAAGQDGAPGLVRQLVGRYRKGLDLLREEVESSRLRWEAGHLAGVRMDGGPEQPLPGAGPSLPQLLPRCPGFRLVDPHLEVAAVRAEYDAVPALLPAPSSLAQAFPAAARLATLVAGARLDACVAQLGKTDLVDSSDGGHYKTREQVRAFVLVRGMVNGQAVIEWTLKSDPFIHAESTWDGRHSIAFWIKPARMLEERWPVMSRMAPETDGSVQVHSGSEQYARALVDEALSEAQEKFVQSLLFGADSVASANRAKELLRELDSEAQLLREAVRMGLPASLLEDDAIHSLLLSPEARLVGPAHRLQRRESGAPAIRLGELAAILSSETEKARLLEERVAALEASGRLPQDAPFLGNDLQRLRLLADRGSAVGAGREPDAVLREFWDKITSLGR